MSSSEKNPAHSKAQWASVLSQDCCLVATAPLGSALLHSALYVLVSEIHRQYPREALRILRNRISTNEPSNEFTKGLVKVGAKRIDYLPAESVAPEGVPIATAKFLESVGNDFPDWPIQARMLDDQRNEVAFGKNQSSVSKVFHAEVMMLKTWGKKIPDGYRIEVSHKPCQMCAGLIYEMSEGKVDVSYEIEVTGSRSRATVLDRKPV